MLGLPAVRVSSLLLLVPMAVAAAATADDGALSYGPVLRVNASDADTYVARGTLPLNPGVTWTLECPFGLRRGGAVYPAQWWPVAFHPDGSPSVVELAATVDGEAAVDPLDPIVEFEVVTSHAPYPFATPSLSPAVLDVAAGASSTRLRVVDSHGNRYVADLSIPFGGAGAAIEVLGRSKAVYATTGLLVLEEGAPDALPYLGGFRAWFTVHDDSPVVELDLRWHNAIWVPGGPMIPRVIFETAELLTPSGWRALPRWPLPTAGEPYVDEIDDAEVFPMIADGPTPHVLRQRGNLTWRFVLHVDGDEQLADDAFERRGWGTLRGARSWQDPKTLGWLTTHTPVPDLSSWEPAVTQGLVDDRAALEHALATGTNYHYATGLGAHGPFHPIGGSYGGQAGGAEIFQTPGTDLLWSGIADGLIAEELRHRMVVDRQHGWFYAANGVMVTGFDLVGADGDLPINMYNNDFINIQNQGALGFELVDDVYADVLPRPEYELDWVGTEPWEGVDQHDAQHGVRATYVLKTLVWSANDRMARHDLIGQAALWHMQLHDGPTGRLGELATWADQHPNVSGEFGRGEAWMLDAVSAWYALSWPGTRGAIGDWIGVATDTVMKMCTPLDVFYGNRTSKIIDYFEFDEQYAITQWYEVGIVLNALIGARQSWALDATTVADLEDVITRAALAVWRVGWKPGAQGPWEQQAVAWIDPDLPAFATLGEIPADGAGGVDDSVQIGGPLGLAARYATAAEQQEIEQAAMSIVGADDAVAGFEAMAFDELKLENRAPLLAWLQLIHP